MLPVGVKISLLALAACTCFGAKPLEFEQSVIQGRLMRPQLVLITADQRPEFKPLVMKNYQSISIRSDLEHISILSPDSSSTAFEFDGKNISYPNP